MLQIFLQRHDKSYLVAEFVYCQLHSEPKQVSRVLTVISVITSSFPAHVAFRLTSAAHHGYNLVNRMTIERLVIMF